LFTNSAYKRQLRFCETITVFLSQMILKCSQRLEGMRVAEVTLPLKPMHSLFMIEPCLAIHEQL